MDKPFQLPGLYMYEYLLVIELPEELRKKVEEARHELTTKYHIVQPQTGRVNISLARFCAVKMTAQKIIQRLAAIAAAEKPFMIELRDYGSYPMHAIFIRIANQPRVLQLIKNLKKARTLMKAGGEDPYFLQDPQVALAGRIDKETYIAAMKEYEENSFSGRFIANAFLLLKRARHEKKYEVVKRFEFECISANSGQAVLFS